MFILWFGFKITIGTLNPYRAPFLDVNWIIDTTNTISVKFQRRLILEMFEMFVLLINPLVLTIPDAMVL